jgi:hypothetical protein
MVGGKINTKLLELKIKVTAMMDLRMNGAIAQKLQVENTNKNMNMNYNLHGTAGEISGLIEARNMEDLDRKLEALRKKDLMLTKGVHPDREIVVEAEVASTPEEAMDEPGENEPGTS